MDASVDVDAAEASADAAVRPIDAAVDVPPDAFIPAVRQINIKGGAYIGVDHPGVWAADPGACSGAGRLWATDPIRHTNDDVLFQSAAVGNHLHCVVDGLPHGTYDVTLLFAELTCCSHGPSREFSIALEGSTVASSFDLHDDGGGCAVAGGPGRPVERTYSAVVMDGVLDIDLNHIHGDPALLSAVAAVQTGP